MTGTRLPMFPLSAVLFPQATMPLHIFEPRYRQLMHDCLGGDPRFGVVLIERGSEVGGGDQRAGLGTRGVITRAAELPDGRWVLEVRGESVVVIEEWLPDDPYPQALVHEPEPVPVSGVGMDPAPLVDEAAQRVRRARAVLAEHGGGSALEPGLVLDGGGDHDVAAWQLCGVAPVNAYDAQRLLAADGAAERLALLVELMDDLELDLRRMLTGEPGESEPGESGNLPGTGE
ncbi:MAG TPA: LON peptidase substrate-binding domain-containing protein [Acidimicrobiales bacterium]|jgi:Lon protease-like protein|nr:LON peptidase substrate-binding domain-containing protein [Acidimicrobiales bacterium]